MIRRTLAAIVGAAALASGVALAAPAAATPVANTTEGTTPVHSYVNRGYLGTRAQTVVHYGVTSGARYVETICYRVQYGPESLNAGLEILRTGDYTGREAAQIGLEDSELDVALIWMHYKLAHGVTWERGAYGPAAADALPVCDNTHGSYRGPAVPVYPARYLDHAAITVHAMPKLTEHNAQTNAIRVQTQCYIVRKGAGAIAAAAELIRTGVYSSGMSYYLGAADSELVLTAKWLHNKLAGGLPSGRGAMSVGTATC